MTLDVEHTERHPVRIAGPEVFVMGLDCEGETKEYIEGAGL